MRAHAVIVLLAVLACSKPPDQQQPAVTVSQSSDIELRVDRESYTVPATLRLQLVNKSTAQLGYNLCPTRLERRSGDAWTNVPDERMCTMELRLLAPSDSAATERALDASLEPGTYRLVALLDVDDQPREVVSPAFTVSRK